MARPAGAGAGGRPAAARLGEEGGGGGVRACVCAGGRAGVCGRSGKSFAAAGVGSPLCLSALCSLAATDRGREHLNGS